MKIKKQTLITGSDTVEDREIKVQYDVEYGEWNITIADTKFVLKDVELEKLNEIINKILSHK
jgi:hypothetical protein